MLVSMLPGVAVTYNGEEIGMENGLVTWEEGKDPSACNGNPEDFNKTSRDFERTPFHWDNTTNAGFNEGAKTWLPVSDKYKTNNLAAQSASDAHSHYSVYKQLMKLRQENVLKTGDYQIVAVSESTLALLRKLSGEKSIVYVFNLSNNSESVDLTKTFNGLSSELTVKISSVHSDKTTGYLFIKKYIDKIINY